MDTPGRRPGTQRADAPIPDGLPVEDCRRCARPMAMVKRTPVGVRRHVARKLCGGCYYVARSQGGQEEYVTSPDRVPGQERVNAALPLLTAGMSLAEVARRLGVPRTTLSAAVERVERDTGVSLRKRRKRNPRISHD